MNLLCFDHNFYHLHINVIIFVSRTCSKKPQIFSQFFLEKVHVPNFGVSGSEDRGGVTTLSNSIILGGWMTKVLKNSDEK